MRMVPRSGVNVIIGASEPPNESRPANSHPPPCWLRGLRSAILPSRIRPVRLEKLLVRHRAGWKHFRAVHRPHYRPLPWRWYIPAKEVVRIETKTLRYDGITYKLLTEENSELADERRRRAAVHRSACLPEPEPAVPERLISKQALRGFGLFLPAVPLLPHVIEPVSHERQLRLQNTVPATDAVPFARRQVAVGRVAAAVSVPFAQPFSRRRNLRAD